MEVKYSYYQTTTDRAGNTFPSHVNWEIHTNDSHLGGEFEVEGTLTRPQILDRIMVEKDNPLWENVNTIIEEPYRIAILASQE